MSNTQSDVVFTPGRSFNISELITLSRRAGEEILKIYAQGDLGTVLKDDQSPLTLADTASNQVLMEGLKALTPDVPILSEESKTVPYEVRKVWSEFWLVDPLDGTKEFIKRNGEYTVNIAYIKDGVAVIGIVFAPALDLMYWSIKGQGAFRQKAGGTPQRIHCSNDKDKGLRVVASRSHTSPETDAYLAKLGPHDYVSMGSSLKFCLVAEGAAHIYPRFIPTMEWDTGAAQCIAEEAGATVKDLNGNVLAYNKPNLLNPFFIVSALND